MVSRLPLVLVLYIVIIFTSFICPAQGNTTVYEYLLRGTIGKFPVVVKVNTWEETTHIDYFYSNSLKDISLDGGAPGDKITLQTNDSSETWQIHKNANGSWTGIWTNNKGIHYPIDLQSANIDTIRHPLIRLPSVQQAKKEDGYEYIRSSLLQVIKEGAPTKQSGYELQYYKIKNTNVRLFSFLPGKIKMAGKINDILLNEAVDLACLALACRGIGNVTGYDYTLKDMYVTDKVLGVDIATGWDCQGQAHPDDGHTYLNIDIQKGKLLKLTDVLDVGAKDEEECMNKVYKILKKLYPQKMANDGECDYSEQWPWTYAQWLFTAAGIYINPSFPHAVANCREPDWSYLPYPEIKRLKSLKKTR